MRPLYFGFLVLLMAACGKSSGAKDVTIDGAAGDGPVWEFADHGTPEPMPEADVADHGTPEPAPDADLPGEASPDLPTPDQAQDPSADVGPDAPGPKNYGFDVRKPGLKDIDHVCHVSYQGVMDGYLYVQATEEKCEMMMGCTYKTLGSWTSVAGVVKPADAVYDFGGGHHNDSIAFSYGGKFFKLYHSYFGIGWRACTPPDCMQVTQGLNGGVLEDGCTEERKLPVQCVTVCPNGTVLEPKDWPSCEQDGKPYYELFDAGCAAGQW